MKKVIFGAILALLTAPVFASNGVTIYGTVEQTVEMTDAQSGSTAVDGMDVVSGDTEIGFSIKEDLGNGTSVFANIEFDVVAEDGSSPTGGEIYVGLTGGLGTVKIGQYDSLTAGIADSSIDAFEGRSVTSMGDVVVDNAIAYVSPSFAGLNVGVAVITEDATTSGKENADLFEYAVMYSNGGLFAGLGYQDNKATGDTNTFVAASLDLGAFSVNGGYEIVDPVAANDYNIWTVGGSFTLGNNVLRAAYQDTENTGNSYTFEGVHNFSKRTAIYANYQMQNLDVANTDVDVLGLGIRHNF